MVQLTYTTAGNIGFDMRRLDFDALTAGKTVTGFNAAIVQWKQSGSSNTVSLLGDNLNPSVSGGVLQGLTGTQITQINVIADTFSLNLAGMAYSVPEFMQLLQARDWAGLAVYVRQGNDVVTGTKNNDTLMGGAGNDSFVSGTGRDVINGGTGNDTLEAMGGHDLMTGGRGADAFQFVAEPVAGEDWWVVIKDFQHGVDRINISDTAFNDVGFGGFSGALMDPIHFHLGKAATTDRQALVYDQSRGVLYYDEDGVGGVDQVILAKLGAGTVLTVQDIWVI